MKKIAMFIAYKGFRDEEYSVPKIILEENNFQVVTVSTHVGTAIGKLGAKVKTDILISDVNTDDYEALCLVGGPGALLELDNKDVWNLFTKASKNKLIGAICISPVALAHANLLEDKKCTCFFDGAYELKKYKAIYTGNDVEVDGNIVTANGPAAAEKYAHTLLKFLK